MPSRSLKDAWVLLRLNLRDIARDYAERHKKSVSALSPDPVDPETIADLVRSLESELDRLAGESEKSPVLRGLKKVFAPNEYEKARRGLVKLFNAYLKAWKAENGGE